MSATLTPPLVNATGTKPTCTRTGSGCASKSMIIGHYGNGIWGNGGIASYIHQISEAQKKDGHSIINFDLAAYADKEGGKRGDLVYARDDNDVIQKALQAKVDILHVHSTQEANMPLEIPTVRTLHGHQPYCPSSTRFLKRWNKPCDRSYSLAGCLQGHLIDHCGSVRPQNLIRLFRYTQFEMYNLQRIPVITVSHFLKNEMVKAGYPADSIHVLHLPAPEVTAYTPPPLQGVPRFVFLGRITRLKGLEWLLNAIHHLEEPVHLDVAGKGDYETEMRQLADRLGIADKITFHGWLNRERLDQLVSNARAVVFPSIWHEPAGLATLDAASKGRAVIGSKVGGLPEYAVHGRNALIVEPNNVQGLTHAIKLLADDWNLARRLGAEGQIMATETFQLSSHMNALSEIYETSIQDYRK